MPHKTFIGGIHPSYNKELSSGKAIRPLDPPPQVTIPLLQHVGAPCSATVKVSDRVKIGTLIGNSDKFISAPIHSSVSGEVKAIKKALHPVAGRYDAVIIDSDGKDEIEQPQWDRTADIKVINPDSIRAIVKQAGIVGLGGAAFPTHVKLTPPKDKKIDTFILNGAECEPYLTCDERVLIEHTNEVLQGTSILMRALGVTKGFIAIEDNKPQAIKAVRKSIHSQHGDGSKIRLVVLHTKYPQGGEKQLIKAVLDREVPFGGLPFDVGCIVDNVQTAYAVYQALIDRKPLYEKVITVTGDAVGQPSNLLVRIGTPISYIIERCGGLKGPVDKIIIGGPMMGISQYSTDTPVIKGTSGILLLTKKSTYKGSMEYCIRCGRCIKVCPMNLIPTAIARAAECDRTDIISECNVQDCMECGSCAYSCPSNIPLVHLIKYAKRSLQ